MFSVLVLENWVFGPWKSLKFNCIYSCSKCTNPVVWNKKLSKFLLVVSSRLWYLHDLGKESIAQNNQCYIKLYIIGLYFIIQNCNSLSWEWEVDFQKWEDSEYLRSQFYLPQDYQKSVLPSCHWWNGVESNIMEVCISGTAGNQKSSFSLSTIYTWLVNDYKYSFIKLY